MRPLIDARFIKVTPRGGIARYVYELIKAMVTMSGQNDISVIVSSSTELKASSLKIYQCDIPVVRWTQQLLMPRYLRRFSGKIDVYHYPHFDVPYCNAPTVVTIHDLKYLRLPGLLRRFSLAKTLSAKMLFRRAITKADAIIAVSEFTKHDLMDLFQISDEKIFVVPHGVDAAFWRAPLNEARWEQITRDHGLDSDFILYVGERRPHKDIPTLLRAFSKVKNEPLQLVIAGRAYANYREPEELIEKFGLAGKAIIIDSPEDADLRELYRRARLFVLPSRYEGFGLPVLEAMAAGTPVITSDCGALLEVGGEAALSFPIGEHEVLAKLICDVLNGNGCDELIQRGHARASDFSWQITAEKTMIVYEAATNRYSWEKGKR